MTYLPPKEELITGMEVYYTDTPGVGGKLRTRTRDFVVEEISDPPERSRSGRYVIVKIRVNNWETNRLIKALSRRLGISRQKIGFAGTKDKRAVTTQLISIDHPEEFPKEIGLKDVEFLEVYRSEKKLELGTLLGNRFNIVIRGVRGDPGKTADLIGKTMEQLNSIGGMPNFFGIQRFGSIRPVTHQIGRHILKGDFKGAVMTYVANPSPLEPEEFQRARERITMDMDFSEALDYYPREYSFERTIISYLSRNDEDWTGALEQLPLNLKMMFVHAYQSYIFNRVLSKRLKLGLPIDEPVVGDIIIPLNSKMLPDYRRTFEVTDKELNHLKGLVRKKKAFVSGPVMGTDVVIAKGEIGELERSIMDEEKVDPGDFQVTELKKISSKGIRRNLLTPVFDLEWKTKRGNGNGERSEPQTNVHMNFSLYKGTYATVLMREIMKTDVMDY